MGNKEGWTREHVFPRAVWPGMANNIVLAHKPCNQKKASRAPTRLEIERARVIYQSMGLIAFIAPGPLSKKARKRTAKTDIAGLVMQAGLPVILPEDRPRRVSQITGY